MKNLLKKAILLTLISISLFTCGKKGALYLPQDLEPKKVESGNAINP